MITVEGLSKKYGQRAILSDVTFAAMPGKVTGLLGPNGAGKSTTMRLILGLETPTSGSALIDGHRYRSLRRPLGHVGAQFDGSGAHKGRTAKAHLTWVALSNGISLSRVGEVLDIVGLSSVAARRVGSFSLGMGQRLGIATALLGDPRILVFDEPANGLDAEGILWLRRLMRDLAGDGRTVLVSSHLMDEMEKTADDVVAIARGRIVKQGSLSSLIEGYKSLEDAYFQWVGQKGEYAARTPLPSPASKVKE